jgi:hypothetical protein
MTLNEEIGKILQIPLSEVEKDPSIANNLILFGFRPGRFTYNTPEYVVNKYNCRSVEFFDSPELLVAGCSQTFGVGVPVEGTWSYFLANSLNVKYANTALPGGSIQTIVNNVLAYIREFGKPKTLALLLPELTRMTVVDFNGLIHRDYAGEPSLVRYEDANFHAGLNNSERPTYSKLPHRWEDVLPSQAPIAQSMSALTMLIQYCRDSDINLVWSSWDRESMSLYLAIVNSEHNKDGFYDGLVSMDDSDLSTNEVICHEDLYEKYGELFHYAWDRAKNYTGHMSVHRHMHIAETFLKRILEMSSNESAD